MSSGVAATADGKGYWVIGSDGGVYAFGDASFYGSLPGVGVKVNDIVGIAPSPDDHGYLLVGSDGGVYAFGDASFQGSLPGIGVHVGDVTGIAVTPGGGGYWLVAADGGVYAFGDAPYEGSLPGLGVHVNSVVGIASTDAGGYWLASSDGGVYAFGDAPFEGSLPGLGVHVTNIVGIVSGASATGFQLIGCGRWDLRIRRGSLRRITAGDRRQREQRRWRFGRLRRLSLPQARGPGCFQPRAACRRRTYARRVSGLPRDPTRPAVRLRLGRPGRHHLGSSREDRHRELHTL